MFGSGAESRVAAGVCVGCGRVSAVRGVAGVIRCEGCSESVKLTVTRGVAGLMPCDDRCLYANGDDCECSCAGWNHRAGHIDPPAWVLERDANRHADKQARAEAKAAKERDRAERDRADLIAAYPELADLLGDRFAYTDDEFVFDMREALRRGRMSPRQIAAAVRLVERARKRDAEVVRRGEERAAAVAAGVRVPSGTVTFSGEIVKAVRATERRGWRESTVVKMTVRAPEGWLAWGTVPQSMYPDSYTGVQFQAWLDGLRGQVVTLTADITSKGDDPLFGFFKRPRSVVLGGVRSSGVRVAAPAPVRTPAPVPVPVPEVVHAGPWAEFLVSVVRDRL